MDTADDGTVDIGLASGPCKRAGHRSGRTGCPITRTPFPSVGRLGVVLSGGPSGVARVAILMNGLPALACASRPDLTRTGSTGAA